MPQPNFIHLRNHSDFSLLQGSMSVQKLITHAVDCKMPALALTDKNNLFGAYEFSISAVAKGIQPIIGLEAVLRDGDNNSSENNLSKLVLLVQNQKGYENLRQLVSDVYTHHDGQSEISFTWEAIKTYNDSLICLSGGVQGAIGQAILHDQHSVAQDHCLLLKEIFADRFYLEIQRHGLTSEKTSEAGFLKLSNALDIPVVATNDCQFASQDMHTAHDVLMCIGENYKINDENRPRLSTEHYFKTSEEMQELFKDIPDAIENSVAIAKRCGFALHKTEPRLPTYKKLQGRSELEALTQLANDGLKNRLAELPQTNKELYQERLEYELDIIKQMGFCGYFLIVADFTQWARNNHIPVGPGRGSGAGSLVSWSLAITDLDPIEYGLLFERFLNPERVSMPDFDIDFCQDKRENVIQYVQNQYGAENVAQIATFGKLQARAVLRDVGRVIGMSYGHVDKICKMVPNNPADYKTLEQIMKTEKRLENEYKNDPQVQQLIDIGKKLEGLCRHVGTHAAGLVIGDKPLSQVIPLYKDARSDMMVTQFNMNDVENVGLVKFDFLGLKTLTVIDKALKLIEKNGDTINISKIPLKDEKTFQLLCKQSAIGVFQLESSGMQNVTRQVQPDSLDDLIAIVALYRPGPMVYIPTYIKRKHGKEKIEYPHPLTQEILKETLGIPIYQEQVMKIAQKFAGYSLGGADLLRRAMGKKDTAAMAAERQKFINGAKEVNNIEHKKAVEVFEVIEKFAEYGFNKTHAAAYALLAYQTAYLKTHYPVEFMTALLCLDNDNTDRLEVLMDECRRMDIELRNVDINCSFSDFSIEKNDDGTPFIRYGLAALKGVGKVAMDCILQARKNNNKFNSIYDFFENCPHDMLNKKLVENLIRAGAFDPLNPNRKQMFESIDILREYGRSFQEQQNSDQSFLFETKNITQNRPALTTTEDWNDLQKAKNELESIGFYFKFHPLNIYEKRLKKLGTKYGYEVIAPEFTETTANIAAVIKKSRIINTKKGKKIAFISVSDTRSNYEITIYEELIEKYYNLIQNHRLIYAKVSVKNEQDNDNRLQLLEMKDLDETFDDVIETLKLTLLNENSVKNLKQILKQHSKTGKSSIHVVLKNRKVNENIVDITLDTKEKVNLTEDLRRAIKSLEGVEEISS